MSVDMAAAIAHYDGLLEHDQALARESGELLATRQPDARLTFGNRLMCNALRPQLLSAGYYDEVRRVCGVLARASKRVEAAMLADPALMDVLDLSDEERRLVLIDPGFEDAAAATRLDSFVAGDSWQFVEYNAESPAGMGYIDTLSELFRELPVMHAFERSYQLRPLPTRASMLEALLRAYRQWGGRGTPLVAIVDWEGLPTATEFEIFREFFERQGVRAIVVDPRGLEFRQGRLHAGATAIDVVYRRVLMHELLAKAHEAPALLRAYEAGAVCVVNAFRCKLLHKKAIFAVLSDEANAHLFDDEALAAIRRHIPWTRRVRDGYSTRDGRRVDLAEVILANREQLVLKPNDEYGGKGVVLGWEVTPGAWEEALRTAMSASYVVQERVPTTMMRYPLYDRGALRMADLIVDLDPYIFGGEVNGMLTRLSSTALLNVTAGSASTVPTFIVENIRD